MEQLTKNDIKWLRSLHQKKERVEQNVFIIEGEKLVEEAIAQTEFEIVQIIGTSDFLATLNKHLPLKHCSSSELERISTLKTPNKTVAVLRMKNLKKHYQGPILVLDGIQDPGNMGTLLRLSDWFGYSEIVCSDDTVEHTNPKVIQASMGSFFRIPVSYTHLPSFLKHFEGSIFGALLEGSDYRQQEKPAHFALIMGNEGKGIRPETLPFITHPITIPRIGEAESLNVATATAILMAQFA